MPAAMNSNGAVTPGMTLEQVTGSLTPRQREILQLLSQGQSNKQIARSCQLSENTIKVHVSAILRALGLNNRTQAGVLMQQLHDATPNSS
jgi:DNA-binding NarL/FixJ family response regulator